MNTVFVELSGESLELAQAEAEAAAATLGGSSVGVLEGAETLFEVRLDHVSGKALAVRLALAHRCWLVPELSEAGYPIPGAPSEAAVFRPFRSPSGGALDPEILRAARTWKAEGGRIDLEHPDHRFCRLERAGHDTLWLEELASVDRKSVSRRRISKLPFRRPVGLDPRLARAAANLGRVPPGGRVVDPFVGTGALLAEAALLGARVVGVDRDATMVQGALRNFAHLGIAGEVLVVGDSGEVEFAGSEGPFAAVLSDLPYGRSAGTGGEDAAQLARRVVPRWADRVAPGGRIVLIVPGGDDPVDPPWRRVLRVPVRVHRSLTREFRVYTRTG